MARTPYEAAMEYALKLLASKPRSVEELREKFSARRSVSEETASQVIERLKELGYLNDQKFASAFALSRIASRPIGKARVKRELRHRKISADVAEEALDFAFRENTEETLIDLAIEKRVRIKGVPSSRQESQKLLAHLIRLGFDFELAVEKVRKIGRSVDR